MKREDEGKEVTKDNKGKGNKIRAEMSTEQWPPRSNHFRVDWTMLWFLLFLPAGRSEGMQLLLRFYGGGLSVGGELQTKVCRPDRSKKVDRELTMMEHRMEHYPGAAQEWKEKAIMGH